MAAPSPQTCTPAHLAEKILTSKTALKGEHKEVTALVVDVSAFTTRSKHIGTVGEPDPEPQVRAASSDR
jgi:hypothetical protein